jgi:hypothetical protein
VPCLGYKGYSINIVFHDYTELEIGPGKLMWFMWANVSKNRNFKRQRKRYYNFWSLIYWELTVGIFSQYYLHWYHVSVLILIMMVIFTSYNLVNTTKTFYSPFLILIELTIKHLPTHQWIHPIMVGTCMICYMIRMANFFKWI